MIRDMVFFCLGCMTPVIKWLTYDLVLAILRGMYSALRICLPPNSWTPGISTWQKCKSTGVIVWRSVKLHVKHGWLHGCSIEGK